MLSDLLKLYERAMLDKEYLEFSLNICRLPDQAKIIDVGCGTGGSTKIIMDCYPNASVIGIDNDFNVLEYATSNVIHKNLKFVCADAKQLPFQKDHFDCCVSRMLLNIVPDSLNYLSEMKRVLKPKGMLILYGNVRSTALGSNLLKNSDKIINGYNRFLRLTNQHGFDVDYIKNILEQELNMKVMVQRIIKDVYNPGRKKLLSYYAIPEEELESSLEENVLVKLKLIKREEIIEYENSLWQVLIDGAEYVSFEQAIIYAENRNTK